jgi:hypothetical protein
MEFAMVLLRTPETELPPTQSANTRIVEARFDNARQVYLLGPFNNWSTTATPMAPVGRDLWIARIPADTADEELSFFVWRFDERFGQIRRLSHV